MNRRTSLMLIGIMLSGLAIGSFPQTASAQNSPLIGTWKLNLDKSKLVGQLPQSATLTYQQDGENIKLTAQVIDARGNATTGSAIHIYDGRLHPSMDSANYDASAYTQVDDKTLIIARFKAGKLVAISTGVVSQDGNTGTVTTTGIDANGRPTNTVAVYDKQ
jgi:hypothetical protein